MKKTLLFLLLLTSFKIYCQTSAPQVIASGGGYTSTPQFSNSYTIGEMCLIETYQPGSFILTQGFQQPNKKTELVSNDFFVPNGITPNGDGTNDVWEIPFLKDYPDCTLKVFNRWGQQLYSNIGYTQPWDGTYKGNVLPTADYYYVITLENGSGKAYTGTITIKR